MATTQITEIPTIYQDAPQVDPSATFSACGYLMREWGETGYTIGFAGRWVDSADKVWHVFQCKASDGSRFLIRADKYGNVDTFGSSTLEREVAFTLEVEVSR